MPLYVFRSQILPTNGATPALKVAQPKTIFKKANTKKIIEDYFMSWSLICYKILCSAKYNKFSVVNICSFFPLDSYIKISHFCAKERNFAALSTHRTHQLKHYQMS
jgi:hypothetical protein